MQRTPANPWDWGTPFLMNQGEVIEGGNRHLVCSGQTALKADPEAEMGISVVAEDDLRGQIEASLANVDAVLASAGMDRSNIVHLTFFTTDVDGFLANYDAYAGWIGDAGIMPTQSLIGVARLVFPELMVEIEVTAAD